VPADSAVSGHGCRVSAGKSGVLRLWSRSGILTDNRIVPGELSPEQFRRRVSPSSSARIFMSDRDLHFLSLTEAPVQHVGDGAIVL
jgi:hypothetical protein